LKSIYSILTIFSLLLLCTLVSNGQNNEEDESFILSGKVIDSATLEGIPFSHIKIDDTYWGVICDSLGFFKVTVKPNQNLKVSSLGFAEKIIPVTSEVTDGSAFQELSLERMSFMLEEVDIYSLGTWEQFKHNFVKTELPKEMDVTGGWNFGNMKLYMKEAIALNRPGGGFGLSMSSGRKYPNRKKILQNLKAKEDKIDKLKLKFNKQIVQEITQVSGKKLEVFMQYIRRREHFTYQTSDIYIQQRVKALYATFVLEYVEGEYDYAMGDSTKTLKNHLRPGK